MEKTLYGLGILLALTAYAQAGDTMVYWGNGENVKSIVPNGKQIGSYAFKTWAEATGKTLNLPQGEDYFPGRTDVTPNFTAVGLPNNNDGSMSVSASVNATWNCDYMQISSSSHTRGMFVWEKDQFFTTARRLGQLMVSSAAWGDTSTTAEMRFVIQEDGDPVNATWYISEPVITWEERDQYFTKVELDVNTIQWYDYSPNTTFVDLSTDSATTPGTTQMDPDFDNTLFRAVGFWFNANEGANWRNCRCVEFGATAATSEPKAKLKIITK